MAVSKFIHLASVKVTPISTITELNKIHKEFIWNHERPKIKEETIINNFERGDLKDVDIPSKITTLQCSWVRRLFDINFYEWKIIEKCFRKIPNFMDPLIFPNTLLEKCQSFTEKLC